MRRSLAPGRRPQAVLLLALAATTACSGRLGERSAERIAGDLPIPEGTTALRLVLANGSFEIKPGTGSSFAYHLTVRRAADTVEGLARLTAIEAKPALRADSGAPVGTCVIALPGAPDDMPGAVFGVEGTIEVPTGLALHVEVEGSGSLVAAGRRAPTNLLTGRGDIRLSDSVGDSHVRTGAGTVIVHDFSGSLDAESATGDGMQVFVRKPGRRLRLITGRGNIQCLVPPSAGFAVDARTEIGRIANGFDLSVATIGKHGAAMVGSRGDQACEVVMRAGSGHLSLSHYSWANR